MKRHSEAQNWREARRRYSRDPELRLPFALPVTSASFLYLDEMAPFTPDDLYAIKRAHPALFDRGDDEAA